MSTTYTAGFLGCGNMGGALAACAIRSVGAECIAVADRDEAKCRPLTAQGATCLSTEALCARSTFIFLGVKPQMLDDAILDMKEGLQSNTEAVIVSMLAAVSIDTVKARLHAHGMDRPVIRIMPNTPTLVGEGMTVYAASEDTDSDTLARFCTLMQASGKLRPLPEGKIDAASAVSGCGPAFAYMFAEALADGGVAVGLTREEAASLASQMLLGAASMLCTYGHPADLKDAVCSPGGTTIEGVRALERGGLRAAAMDAVRTAYDKTLKLKG